MKIWNAPPIGCCLVCVPPTKVADRQLVWLRRGVLQLCVLRPITAFVSVVAALNNSSTERGLVADSSSSAGLHAADQASLVLALYCLFAFWRGVRNALKASLFFSRFPASAYAAPL